MLPGGAESSRRKRGAESSRKRWCQAGQEETKHHTDSSPSSGSVPVSFSWPTTVTPWLIPVPCEAVGTPDEICWNRILTRQDGGRQRLLCHRRRQGLLTVGGPTRRGDIESQTGPALLAMGGRDTLAVATGTPTFGILWWSQGWCESQLSLLREEQIAASRWALIAVPLTLGPHHCRWMSPRREPSVNH